MSSLEQEAERAVLGSLLIDNTSLYRMGGLEDADFEDALHRRLFSTIRDAIVEGRGVDPMSARALVEGDEDWTYLCECAGTFPSAANAEEWARLLRRNRARKSIRFACEQAMLNTTGREDPNDIGAELVTTVSRSLIRDRADMDYATAAKRLAEHESQSRLAVSTTIPTLDAMLGGGFQPGRLYVLGARPGCFKSALAQQAALTAQANGHPSGMLSLEMPPEEIAYRGIAHGYGREGEMRIDCDSYTIDDISARIAEWKYQREMRLVVVDYLQLIGGRGKSRFDVLCDVSRRLKLLAKQFELAILAPAQISREVEKEHRAPKLSDLRECGNIEQDADCVMFIHHRVIDEEDDYSLMVAKQRSGMARCKPIALAVDGPRFRVREKA